MGDKKDAQVKLIEQMDEAMKTLEYQFGKLSEKLLSEFEREKKENGKLSSTDTPATEKIKLEMAKVTSQISYVKTAKKEFEELLQKEEKEEERQKIENVLKHAILIGAISEEVRRDYEREKQEEQERKKEEAEKKLNEVRFEKYIEEVNRTADEIFALNEFQHVKREDVEDIMNDKELKNIAENDPAKLERDEKFIRDEYDHIIENVLYQNSLKMSDNPDENKATYYQLIEKRNGYKQSSTVLKDFLRSEYDQLESEEDKQFIKDIEKEISELAEITLELQKKSASDDSQVGNGYTKELYKREQDLTKKIKEYWTENMNYILAAGQGNLANPNGNQSPNRDRTFTLLTQIMSHVERQATIDETMHRFHENNRQRERFYVYQRMPNARRASMAVVKTNIKNESKAFAKITRIDRSSSRKGDDIREIGLNAMQKAEKMMSLALKKPNIKSAEDIKTIKEGMASVLLYHIIENEQRTIRDPEDRPFQQELEACGGANEEGINNMVNKLMHYKSFTKTYDKFVSEGKIGEKAILFLADDFEKAFAKKVSKVEKVKLKPDRRMSIVAK